MQAEPSEKAISHDLLDISIPSLKSYPFPDLPWNTVFSDEYSQLFLDEADHLTISFQEQITDHLNIFDKSFRMQMTINTVPVLVAYIVPEKLIRIYSPKLNYELSVIKNIDDVQQRTDGELKIYQNQTYIAFRKHVEAAVSLNPHNFPSEIEVTTKLNSLNDVFKDTLFDVVEKRENEIVQKLLIQINKYSPSLFERISDYSLGLTASYALLRIHLLKFIAILPSLDHDNKGHEVKRILLESLRRLLWDSIKSKVLKRKGQERTLPNWLMGFLRVIKYIFNLIPAYPLAYFVRFSIKLMAKRFIAGESIESATKVLKGLARTKRDVTLDQLGELVVSEKEADYYSKEVIKLIRGYKLHVSKGSKNKAGILKAHVSIKVSALCSDFKPYAFDYTYQQVAPRLIEILTEAKKYSVFINIDAEHYDYRDSVFEIYKKVLLETKELQDYYDTGIVLQAYLRDAAKHFQDIVDLAKARNIIMPIRLVKGAYWDAETVAADAHSFNAPEFLNKDETDLHFRQLIIEIYKSFPYTQLCIASHNYSDHAFAEALRELYYNEIPIIEHQCLHMTYEALSTGMGNMNWVVRNYVPIGSLLVGMAYLVRRIMENSSQVGVLTIMRSHKKHRNILSAKEIHLKKKELGGRVLDSSQINMTYDFFNIPPVRLYIKEQREKVERSLKYFREHRLNQVYANDFECSGELVTIKSNSDLELVVGTIQFANVDNAKKALDMVTKSYNEGIWSKSKTGFRSSILLKAASIMTIERLELANLIVYEAGKSILEALGDVDEAIDFLSYYAKEEMKFHELNKRAISRGPIAVIAPWNFPLAIPCGMTAAALVAGNSVILKSAEQTPLISCQLINLLHRAGVPKEVLIHLPGPGETVGKELVNSDKISGIVFTGSKEVGMQIFNHVSKRIYYNKLYNLKYPCRVITEMGGKNAVLVTANAELDETVAGILYSAFAHAGQKCSAASRVLVDNSIKKRLVERLREACLDMKVGVAYDFATFVNPVVSKFDQERLKQQVKEAIEEVKKFGGQVIVDRSKEKLPGTCVGPVIIELPKSRLAESDSYCRKELFGPVLHLIGFNGLEEGVELFNSSEYALTGGIFSQSQDDVDFAVKKMEAGNIYINRTITGARVAIEPFGGFKLSGTGPKAGGKGYLQSFHNIRFEEDVFGGKLAATDEEGPNEKIILAEPSPSITSVRTIKLVDALEEFIDKYELFYQGIYLDRKEHLVRYRKWISKHLVRFQTEQHANRVIPGQLSYNDFTQQIDHSCFIAYEKRPYLKTLLNVFSALGMGSGITIIARNKETYKWWIHFQNLLFRAGFLEDQFKIYYASENVLLDVLKRSDIGVLFIDGHIERVEKVLNATNISNKDLIVMRKVLTPHDSPSLYDFNRICAEYAWVRSLAVNTMRHGAPLDLSF